MRKYLILSGYAFLVVAIGLSIIMVLKEKKQHLSPENTQFSTESFEQEADMPLGVPMVSLSEKLQFIPNGKITKRDMCQYIETSIRQGRVFFKESLEESYHRVMNMPKPIQVDLYILAHFLMYQDQLQFMEDENEASRWKESVSNYFLNSFGRGVWEKEGCLAVKGLIGLEKSGRSWEEIQPIANYYYWLIQEHWKNNGVGECFSDKIQRTFGAGKSRVCSSVSEELNAKVAYYKATTRFTQGNPLTKVNTSALNEAAPRILAGWWDILPEMWVLKTYRAQNEVKDRASVMAESRFLAAVKSVTNTITSMNIREKKRTANSLDILLYSYLLAHREIDDYAHQLALQILRAQEKGGWFPVDFGEYTFHEGHNVYATPVYFSLLALTEFQSLAHCQEAP